MSKTFKPADYGMTKERVAKLLKDSNLTVDEKHAEAQVQEYHKTFPKLKARRSCKGCNCVGASHYYDCPYHVRVL